MADLEQVPTRPNQFALRFSRGDPPGAESDAGTSVERRNVRENATRMGRAVFARGFVAGLARVT